MLQFYKFPMLLKSSSSKLWPMQVFQLEGGKFLMQLKLARDKDAHLLILQPFKNFMSQEAPNWYSIIKEGPRRYCQKEAKKGS